MVIRFILLLCAGYLLGAIPLSYLMARRRGIDLTRTGTRQVGAGNFWRVAGARKIGIVVWAFDLVKGALLMWAGSALGLSVSQQVWTGVAVIIGHNWPVFLKFKGGRGVAIAIGIVFALPVIDGFTYWVLVCYVVSGVTVLLVTRSTPLPVLVGLITGPIASAIFQSDVRVTVALAAIVAVIIIKRLTAMPPDHAVPTGELLVNRLLFDRDIRDRKQWMYRQNPANNGGTKQ